MDLKDFDPDGTGLDNGNYFGLPSDSEDSALVLISVPWDLTVSYGTGARFGPDAIIGASSQLDLYDQLYPDGWRRGIATLPVDYQLQEVSQFLREDVEKIIRHLEKEGKQTDEYVIKRAVRINTACDEMNLYVENTARTMRDKGKITGLVGGDHSTPFGLIKTLSEEEPLTVLHIDAHADLRPGYEGFEFSHASIMYNVATRLPGVERIVQVGIRDYCNCEARFTTSNERINTFTDYDLASNLFCGMTWEEQCNIIISRLSERVYISFDIDGLSPELAPNTGTPVPGGLSFNQAVWLLDRLVQSGRKIVGFDLCETAPGTNNEWDGNVGARMLYKLCLLTLKSNPE